MTASINASTSSGVVVTSDTSGNLAFQSNGTTVATVSSSGFSSNSLLGNANQTYQNVTASRTNGTTYTNSTGAPILVLLVASDASSQALNMVLTVGGVTLTTISGSPAATPREFTVIVPVGATYSASWNASATFNAWWELR